MGVFWSMKSQSHFPRNDTFIPNSATTISSYALSVFPGHHSLEHLCSENCDPQAAASTDVSRRWMAGGVRRITVSENNIRGKLFLPPGVGPFPGVLEVSNSTGVVTETRAVLLASRGYATLSLTSWEHPGSPSDTDKPEFSYVMEAIDWLTSHPEVVSDHVGVVGFSRGGHVSLLLAQHHPKVKAAVNISGAPFCILEGLNWKQQPFQKGVSIDYSKVKEISQICFNLKYYLPDWRNHLVEAWKGAANILYVNGADDHYVNPVYARYWFETVPRNDKHRVQLLTYPWTGHVIDTPFTPMCRVAFHKPFNFSVFMGGLTKPQAFAKQDSWNRILNFLQQNLKVS